MSDVDVAARRLDAGEEIVDDAFDAYAFRLRGEVGEHTMSQYRQRDALDVIRRRGHATREQRVRLRAEDERLARARSRTPAHVSLHEIGGARVVGARGAHE